ncbi:ABC transporter permease [Protaetiibacter mangrovi]|uniref:ABC transporter permease n=1 Tax=Protaetiibacter mangrovi TaxID=2970926 RepID=A0ABT1ZGH9_9MICO|nr:ABC transporter permease [Protaetiibacter mangrovi]MCS0499808.1 ABC transporter permease [Protaetiibacter mangrovi]
MTQVATVDAPPTGGAPGPAARSAATPAWRRVLGNPWTIRVISLVVFLGVWEYFGRDLPYVISSPSAIWAAAVEHFWPEVWPAFLETLRGLGAGFGLAILVGVPLGLLMSFSPIVETALSPYLSALYATPRITLIPVLVLWLGISFEMRIGIVFLSAVFPIMLNTYLGGKEVDQGLLDVGKAFKASGFKVYRSIYLRGSVPYIFAGLHLGLGRGLMGVVVAEIATSAGGIGNLISYYAKYFRIDSMFVAVVVLGLFAVFIAEFLTRFNTTLNEPWNRRRKKEGVVERDIPTNAQAE